jgi:hypothetical protein
MRLVRRIAAAFLGTIAVPALAVAATIGGAFYATQYDFREFWAATDGKQFQVVLAGDAFPGVDRNTVAQALLPRMQAAKPRPALTFTYTEPTPTPRPNYRLVLIFNPALNLNADPVCAGSEIRYRPNKPGVFYVYAIYCRNDRAMSYTTAWVNATSPTDPQVEQLFRELFRVVFSEQTVRWSMNDQQFR